MNETVFAKPKQSLEEQIREFLEDEIEKALENVFDECNRKFSTELSHSSCPYMIDVMRDEEKESPISIIHERTEPEKQEPSRTKKHGKRLGRFLKDQFGIPFKVRAGSGTATGILQILYPLAHKDRHKEIESFCNAHVRDWGYWDISLHYLFQDEY